MNVFLRVTCAAVSIVFNYLVSRGQGKSLSTVLALGTLEVNLRPLLQNQASSGSFFPGNPRSSPQRTIFWRLEKQMAGGLRAVESLWGPRSHLPGLPLGQSTSPFPQEAPESCQIPPPNTAAARCLRSSQTLQLIACWAVAVWSQVRCL